MATSLCTQPSLTCSLIIFAFFRTDPHDILGPVLTSSPIKVVQGWQGGPHHFFGTPCITTSLHTASPHLQPHHFGGLRPPLPEVRRSTGQFVHHHILSKQIV